MSYFSRLSDIVTCNLSDLLNREDDPQTALEHIVHEMEEGLNGARRSVATAETNAGRLAAELDEHRSAADAWNDTAKQELEAGNEDAARLALVRKQETEDVIAGLEQQHAAALGTRDHLQTTLRALQARLAEARRKLQEHSAAAEAETVPSDDVADRAQRVDEELDKLKKELGQK